MFYTLTLNPALDYIVETDSLNIGATNRSGYQEIQFGGKGINVSYVLTQLGVENTALGFIAGFTGDELERLTELCKIKTDLIRLKNGMTRINVKLKGEVETEINAAGPFIPPESVDELFSRLDGLGEDDTLVLSGSVPSGVSSDIYERIMQRLQPKGVRFAVDASKDALLKTLKYKPFLVKPNVAELEETVGKLLKTDGEIADAAKYLQSLGAQNVLVSRGEKGAILLDRMGIVHNAPAHDIKAQNTVGAGDSMVAGFLAGADKTAGFHYAMRLALAAGSATAASKGLATKAQIEELLK